MSGQPTSRWPREVPHDDVRLAEIATSCAAALDPAWLRSAPDERENSVVPHLALISNPPKITVLPPRCPAFFVRYLRWIWWVTLRKPHICLVFTSYLPFTSQWFSPVFPSLLLNELLFFSLSFAIVCFQFVMADQSGAEKGPLAQGAGQQRYSHNFMTALVRINIDVSITKPSRFLDICITAVQMVVTPLATL